MIIKPKHLILILLLSLGVGNATAQKSVMAKADLGSQTARNGFKNEDEIRDKFNNWKVTRMREFGSGR